MTTGTEEARTQLDPFVAGLDGESARLRAAGPLAAVEPPGGVPVRAVTHHAEARAPLTDPRPVKDINVWGAWRRGETPAGRPLTGPADPGRPMLTVDGAEHRRLRALVAQAPTARPVEHLRGRITELTGRLLDGLPADGVVVLEAAFAHPLPMYVVAGLMGIEEARLPRPKVLSEEFFPARTPPEEVVATLTEPAGTMAERVAAKRAAPGDDLTGALVTASEDGGRLTDEESVSTLRPMAAAGRETTISLIVGAVVSLPAHPEQRALALSGEADRSAVTEAGLRYSSPASHVPIRFATEDVPVGDRVLPAGDALIVSYGALDRDGRAHGPTAGAFDITRASRNRHVAFGHGPHVCPGAAPSHPEAGVALPALYARRPGWTWRFRWPNRATDRWSRGTASSSCRSAWLGRVPWGVCRFLTG